MPRLVEDVRNYLISNLPGRTIKLDVLGPTPDDMIVVMDDRLTPTVRSTVVNGSFSVVIRAGALSTAIDDSRNVYSALHNKSDIFPNVPTRLVKANHTPVYSGVDENGRHIYFITFRVSSKGF